MNILDLIIDSEKTVGKKLLITDVRPYYSYDGNQRLEFWNSVKLDDSSGSNYTASKNKK